MDPVSCAEIKPYAPVMMDKSEEISHLFRTSPFVVASLVPSSVRTELSGRGADFSREEGREGRERAALSGPLHLY